MNKSPKANRSRLFIDRNGNLTALCDNIIDNVPDLGTRHIKREANIKFNNATQVWEVQALDGTVMAEHHRRDAAVQLERMLVNMTLQDALVNS